jgi:GNAT superfamily N-acetyltransferase
VGWISVAPRTEFPSLDRSAMLKPVDDQPVWSIVCFFISNTCRGEGLSGKLVQAAVAYAREHGATILEAYPNKTTSSHCLPPERYMGVLSTFQKAGFRLAADRGGKRLVLRCEPQAACLPALQSWLPGLMHFGQELAWEFQCGRLPAEALHERITAYYSAQVMADIEKILPGWGEMASYARGQTLVHTTCMLLATLASPEYAQASHQDQRLLEWIAVLHDLGKQASPHQRHHAHAFRSAALAARLLPNLGFPTREMYAELIEGWSQMTCNAVVKNGDAILQDNAFLPQILDGIAQLFGAHSPAGRIVQSILLHMSLDTVPEWPCPAGLDDVLARQLIEPELLPLLTAVMLADSDAWNLYHPPIKERYRQMTLAYLDRVWPAQKCAD